MYQLIKIGLVLVVIAAASGLTVAATAEETQGRLKAVFPEKREFVLDNAGKTTVFQMAKDGRVMIDNRPAKLEDLLPGEDVHVIFDRPIDMPEATEIRCKRN